MSLRLREAVAGVACVACVATASAAASRAPRHALRFDPVRGAIGGIRIGSSKFDLERLLGKPDRVVTLGAGTPVWLWMRDKRLCSVYAQAGPSHAHSNRITEFIYRGAFTTSKGDRIGTPLATVRRHWRGGWHAEVADPGIGMPGPNYGRRTSAGSAAFGFDGRRRVAGIRIASIEQFSQPIVAPRC